MPQGGGPAFPRCTAAAGSHRPTGAQSSSTWGHRRLSLSTSLAQRSSISSIISSWSFSHRLQGAACAVLLSRGSSLDKAHVPDLTMSPVVEGARAHASGLDKALHVPYFHQAVLEPHPHIPATQ